MKNTNNNYSWQGMLIITGLGIVGSLILLISGFFEAITTNNLYDYIYDNGFEAIIGIFFILICLYCWILFFRNVIIKPKEETLYLLEIEHNTCKFLDKEGKAFYFNNNKYIEGKYYLVLKTHDNIKSIKGESYERYDVKKEKKSYWLNMYSPLGNFENMLLLPIVYVILTPGILSIIMSKGFDKIYGILFSAVPMYILTYDTIYKIKLLISKDNTVDESKFILSYYIFMDIIRIIAMIFVCAIFIIIFIKCDGPINKLIFSPFLLCVLCSFARTLAQVFKNEKLENIFLKSYIVIFLLYWFGLLIYFLITSIINKEYTMILFTIPFWIVGFFIIYKFIIKDK